MIFILDNYDSFTYNLVQAIASLDVPLCVARNDSVSARDIAELNPEAMILSPGPGRPEQAGLMPEIFAEFCTRIPILGVCLGHQMIAGHFGARIVSAAVLVHGKASRVSHDDRGVFRGLPNPIIAGRYHSLAVDEATLPSCLKITARTEDGEIMGLRHTAYPVEGVQFHPESILTPLGNRLLKNFLAMVSRDQQKAVLVT